MRGAVIGCVALLSLSACVDPQGILVNPADQGGIELGSDLGGTQQRSFSERATCNPDVSILQGGTGYCNRN